LNNAELNRNITDIQLGKQQDSQDSQQMDSEVVFAKVVQHKRVVGDSDKDDDTADSGVEFMATIKQEKGTVRKTDKNEEPYM
jgi:hypothetical protein